MNDNSFNEQPDYAFREHFTDQLNHYNTSHSAQLGYLSASDLRDIAFIAQKENDPLYSSARQLFKKILMATPSWFPAASFAASIPESVYSNSANELVKVEDSRAVEQRRNIDIDVNSGASPWLAHVKNNEHGLHNPYMVGFYQIEGKIHPVFGERYFRSQRQIDKSLFIGRIETKEVNLLSTQFQNVEGATILKSKYWDLLPEDLKSKFENGEILITEGKDLYQVPEDQLNLLAQSDNPMALHDQVQQSIRSAEAGYYLLYYSDRNSNDTGRTGVLTRIIDGQVKPILIVIEGKEYVIELKGCGTKEGGFTTMHYRTGREILTGGAEQEQAINEFHRLSENEESDKPKPIGSILFTNNGYEQGYIIRLTPSTIRASYSGNEVYPKIDSPENVEVILKMYAGELTEQIFAPNPKILDRSSHTENLLIWGDGQTTFTDFSDQVAFNDTNFPHYEDHGGFMTPRQMLFYYIKMVKEIPGYSPSRDQITFYEALSSAFVNNGQSLNIDQADTTEMVTQKIWEQGGMANLVFKARKQGKYIPEGVLREFNEAVNRSMVHNQNDLDDISELSSIERFHSRFEQLKQAFVVLQTSSVNPEDRVLMEECLAVIEKGELLTSEDKMNLAFRKWRTLINRDDQVYEQIEEAFSFYGYLSYTLSPIMNYLKHESDVIHAAMTSASPHEREDLIKAEQELKERMELFARTTSNPHTLYQLLTEPEQARRMVELSYYTK